MSVVAICEDGIHSLKGNLPGNWGIAARSAERQNVQLYRRQSFLSPEGLARQVVVRRSFQGEVNGSTQIAFNRRI